MSVLQRIAERLEPLAWRVLKLTFLVIIVLILNVWVYVVISAWREGWQVGLLMTLVTILGACIGVLMIAEGPDDSTY